MIQKLTSICENLNLISHYDLCSNSEYEIMYIIVDRLNKLIAKQQNDKINTNEDLIKLRDTIKYLLDGGMKTEVIQLLSKMYADGTLQEVVQESMIDINKKLKDNKNSINKEAEDRKNSILSLKEYIDKRTVIFESDKEDCSEDLQELINDESVNEVLIRGLIKLKKPITLKSNFSIVGERGRTIIESYGEACMKANPYTEFILIKDLILKNKSLEDNIGMILKGGDDTTIFQSSVNNIRIENVNILDYELAMRLYRVRQATISQVGLHGRSGILYQYKSAEVNITDSYIVHQDNKKHAGSFGIKAESDGAEDKYPEGLTVTNTLLYRHEKNIDIKDLYVANFTACHIDNEGSYTKPITINSVDGRATQLTFTSCWIYSKGIVFDRTGISAPREVRSQILNCKFDNLEGGGIEIQQQYHEIKISDCTFTGNGTSSDKICVNAQGANNAIYVNDCSAQFMSHGVIMNGNLEANARGYVKNFSMGQQANKNPHYFEYPIEQNIKANDNYIIKAIDNEKQVNTSSIIVEEGFSFAKGLYQVTVLLNVESATDGFIQGQFYDGENITNKIKVISSTGNSIYAKISSNDKFINFSFLVECLVPGAYAMQIKTNETATLQTGYNGNMVINSMGV